MRTSVDVHNFLLERDLPHELVALRGRPRGADRVAAVLDLPPQQVGRVVLYQGQAGPVAALVPAMAEAHAGRVAAAAGEASLDLIAPDRATELTGFLEEAMPPVSLPGETRYVIDRTLAEEELLYFPGGEVTRVLKVRSADLIAATGAVVAPVTG